MLIGKLVDNVWATRKAETLNGTKFMLAEIVDRNPKEIIVVADVLGAGIGDKVIIVTGSSARRMHCDDDIPIDATVVGIIDESCNSQ